MVDPESNNIVYEYDTANRLTRIGKGNDHTDYYYDPAGWVTKRILGNDSYTVYSYDSADRITAIDNKESDSTVISSFDYVRDKTGAITKMTYNNGDYIAYSYDAIYRLTKEDKDDTSDEDIYAQEFYYDEAGNRTKLVKSGTIGSATTTYEYNSANQLTKDTTGGSSNSYYYDDNGNLTKKNDGTDDYVYVYDAENRMTSYDGPGTSNDTDYVYAASSWERIKKTVDSTTTKFLRDGSNVVAEYDGSDTLIATYVNGLRIDEHLSKTISGRTYYYLVDHLGSVRELIDSSEVTQNSYDYSSFGEVVGSPTENVSNAYRFTGREWDSENSSQYHRSRTYFPSLGRWNRKDPIGFVRGANLYLYVKGNPVLYTDVYGLQEEVGGHPLLQAEGQVQGQVLQAEGQGQVPGRRIVQKYWCGEVVRSTNWYVIGIARSRNSPPITALERASEIILSKLISRVPGFSHYIIAFKTIAVPSVNLAEYWWVGFVRFNMRVCVGPGYLEGEKWPCREKVIGVAGRKWSMYFEPAVQLDNVPDLRMHDPFMTWLRSQINYP